MNYDGIPEIMSFAAQPVDWQGELRQSFTLGLGFDLLSGQLLSPSVVYASAMQALQDIDGHEAGLCLDHGVPKKEAEWLLAGMACAPIGETVTGLVVDMRVGESRRRILVEDTQPFSALALSWANTWASDTENPLGLPVRELRRANVVDANLPFGTPACPAPRGPWPCRMQRMGTYDAAWLTTRWPGTPDDFDWSFYNLAQASQRLPMGIRGDEELELTCLHPSKRRILGHLPGKTLRLFVSRKGEWYEHAVIADTVWLFPNQLAGLLLWHALVKCSSESGADIEALRAEILPPEPLSVADVAHTAPDGFERTSLAMATGAAAPIVASASTLTAAHATDSAAAHATDSAAANATDRAAANAALGPKQDTAEGPLDYKAFFSKGLDDNLAEINAGLAESGLPPLSPEQLQETRTILNSAADEMQAIEKQMAVPPPNLSDTLRNLGVPEGDIAKSMAAFDLPMPDPALSRTAEEWESAVQKYLESFAKLMHPSQSTLESMRTSFRLCGPGGDTLLETMAGGKVASPEAALTHVGMPPDKAAAFLELIDADMPRDPAGFSAYARQVEVAGGFPEGSVTGTLGKYQEALQKAGFAPPKGPDIQEPTSEPKPVSEPVSESVSESIVGESCCEPIRQPRDRESVIAWLAQGKSLAGCDLSRIDLANLNLSGQDLRGVDLSGGSVAHAQLVRANLSGARLIGCDCACADFTDAQLTDAVLEGALASKALFLGANLTRAVLTGIQAQDADFSKSVLDHSVLTKGCFADATFSHVQGESVDARCAIFRDARLRFCRLPKAVFSDAELRGADVHDSVLDGADFRHAQLDCASFCYGTSVALANLCAASLCQGVWTEVRAQGAVFTGVQATGASFCDGDYTGSVWRGADLREGDFSRSVLQGADMEGVNLFKGSLREAHLKATNLRNANLYAVDLTRAATDAGTIFDCADVHNTIRAARESAQESNR
ncbi:MAG: pentapeptide repeat-containing protein [Desulfovibrionaceae bacterium]|nr:pentapeptide repeat-containing protein [Desulfovibrionaceae bacterium]